ncbi:Spy/CpxP family protein refolding chaperone [Paracidovorax sp. MALMAid1276]|uniref:Spy/CpxP family protein refolding chaperone n=1 Tax=Paracidovorax sp. MALMAid1276 TaxID=3411631 RepID=UPI003B9A91A4
MKPWIKKTLTVFFGTTIALGGLTACSSAYHHRGPMSAEKMAEVRAKVVQRVSNKLDLDEAQKQKLNTLADAVQAQRAAWRGSANDPRTDMQAIVSGAKFDRARAQALVEEKTRLIQSASPEVIKALADFYDSLDAGQQEKVRAMLQQHRRGFMPRA